ncbi:MAG: MBG domain-containing protein, partial [Terracidiphilus sp.]
MTEALGTIASTTGTVTLTNASGSAPAVAGESITLLDTLATGAGASAVLSSPDGSQLTLSSSSVMELFGKVSATRFIKILTGRIWAQIVPNSDRCSNDSEVLEPCDALDVSTPNAAVGIRGTDVVIETDGTTTTVTVNEGTVNVTDLTGDTFNSVTSVSAGSTLTVAPHSVPTPAVTATPNLAYFEASVGASMTQNISLSINTALTISRIVTGGDYSVGTNSCVTAYSAATTCTVPITFTPTKPGQAWVPLVVTDSNNNSYSFGLEGTGIGSAVAFTPGIINTVVGNGTACPDSSAPCGDNGPATSGELSAPSGMAMDGAGNIYIADSGNNRIRVVNTQTSPITVAGVTIGAGNIATVAGNGAQGNTNTGNGGVKATTAELNSPGTVAVDGPGNMYVADTNNSLVRKVDVNGMMTTFAGGGSDCANATDNVGDGCPATGAQLAAPTGLAVDTLGYVYIADSGNARIRKVNLNGMITTFAGDGTPGYNGDSGAATSAELKYPAGLAFDSVGDLYIADSGNNVIRMVNTSGTITTVAGDGSAGYGGDGLAAKKAELNQPRGAAVDSAGNLYIADTKNDFLRKVDVAGVITTVAGSGSNGVSCPFGTSIGDGCPATSAFVQPWSVAVNGAGNLYVPDYGNNRIRKVNATTSLLSFGTLNPGAISTPQMVAASNVGNAPLGFAQSNAFVPSANFQLQNVADDCANGGSLAPGAGCSLGVAFSPTTTGNPITGTLTVNDDAPNGSQTVQLTGIALIRAAQTITFPAIASQTAATTLKLTATASSGLEVGFASLTKSVCTVSGATTSLIAAGTCTIQASQPGNAAFDAAPNVNRSFTVNHAAQTITFKQPASPVTYSVKPIALSAKASSKLAVTFSIVSGPAKVSDTNDATLTITGAGTVVVAAKQAGNATYAAAPEVTRTIKVNKAAQTITFPAIGSRTIGTKLALSATASSKLTVSFASLTKSVCTVSGETASLVALGTCTIRASQAGNTAYDAAPNISQSFTVGHAQSITFKQPASPVTYGVKPIALSATASSKLAVTFSVVSGPAKVSGTHDATLTITGAGTVVVAAKQAGNATYGAAQVTRSIVVNKATLTVTANNLTMKQGATVPKLTYTMKGFVNGDKQAKATTGQPALSTSATSKSAPGKYPI